MIKSKEKLHEILHGEMNFYFRFMEINVYKDGVLKKRLTDEAGSTFRRGGLTGGIVATIDIDDDDTWAQVQETGAFQNMYSGFDLFLNLDGWREKSDTGDAFIITYPILAGGIDLLVLTAEKENISLRITSGKYVVELTSVLNFN